MLPRSAKFVLLLAAVLPDAGAFGDDGPPGRASLAAPPVEAVPPAPVDAMPLPPLPDESPGRARLVLPPDDHGPDFPFGTDFTPRYGAEPESVEWIYGHSPLHEDEEECSEIPEHECEAYPAIPNMIGASLRHYRGVDFRYLLPGSLDAANASRVLLFRNTSIAQNNSAVPRDRVMFRYNGLFSSLDVRGLEPAGFHTESTNIALRPGAVTPDFNRPNTFVVPGDFTHVLTPTTLAISSPGFPPVTQTIPAQTTTYRQTEVRSGGRRQDMQQFTFGFEKTFLDSNASIELRLPFAQTLNPNMNLAAGSVDPSTLFVQATPGATIGGTDVQFQDVQGILKAVLYKTDRVVVSGGLGVTAPTAPDLRVEVVDFSGNEGLATNPRDPLTELSVTGGSAAIDRRVRTFELKNETWLLSPFLAMAARPTARTFLNGFWQVDAPVGRSDWRYTSLDVDMAAATGYYRDHPTVAPGLGPVPPFVQTPNGIVPQVGPTLNGVGGVQTSQSFTGKASGQWLTQLSLGGGYWLYQNPCARWITGLASLAEVHYATTLGADRAVQIPAQTLRAGSPPVTGIGRDPATGAVQSLALGPPSAAEPQPRIGAVGGHVAAIGGTLGATMYVGQTSTATIGYGFPIADGDLQRLFRGELNVQINCYFGGSRGALPASCPTYY